jgi:hypothetical protein
VHYAEDHLVHQFDKEVDGINFFITKWFDETHFYKKIAVKMMRWRAIIFTEKVAKFSLVDFTEMFAFQGLMIESFGDYNFADYHVRKSPIVMVARKK